MDMQARRADFFTFTTQEKPTLVCQKLDFEFFPPSTFCEVLAAGPLTEEKHWYIIAYGLFSEIELVTAYFWLGPKQNLERRISALFTKT